MNIFKAIMGGGGQSVSPTDAQAMIKGDNPPFILDVRQPDEFKSGHIAGAKLIPLNELASRMDELPPDREILCVCRSGARSGMAAGQMRRAGYNVVNMRDGMIGWQGAKLPVKKGSK